MSLNLQDIWQEFLASVKWIVPFRPDPLEDPRVQRAQEEADELADTVRRLQAQYDLRTWSSNESHKVWPKVERRSVRRNTPQGPAPQ